MAEVRPLRALHYNLAVVESLDAVTAPPYDVVEAEQRRDLLARSPFNVVEIDLPVAPGGGDPYEHAAETLEAWTLEGVLTADREPAIWALTQEYAAAGGTTRTRHGILARVRIEPYGPGAIRPHERTQPGPKEDRLRLTQATRHNLSPIFSLHPGSSWDHVEPALGDDPWGEVIDADGTVHRLWRVPDPVVHEAIAEELAGAELLIADGHHRYETARAYADSIAGDDGHSYTLMCLVSLDDPGLTVFPTHRLLTGLDEPERQEALGVALKRVFEVEEVSAERLDPAGEDGVGVFGYVDSRLRRPFRLRLRGLDELDRALAGRPEAYRRLDAVILETLVLHGILGMSEEDIAAKRGIAYTNRAARALAEIESARADCAFLLRPTPVEQIREVTAAGETMPPKSTYFFPKVLTGLVFNPLS
jgi:uncharacterized protein (DUF1015 family)